MKPLRALEILGQEFDTSTGRIGEAFGLVQATAWFYARFHGMNFGVH